MKNIIAILLTLAFLLPPAHAQDAKPGTPPPPQIQDPFEGRPLDGHYIFSGQPTEQQLRDFAALGGKMVVNSRTQGEMDKLGYDEAALCKELGLTYTHLPMPGYVIDPDQPHQLGQALAQNQGPVLMHCKSGSRIAMLYGLHLASCQQLPKDQALAHAITLGMSSYATKGFKKADLEPSKQTHEDHEAQEEQEAKKAAQEKPRFQITNATIEPIKIPNPFADNKTDGRLIFAGQPTEEELRAFAALGGTTVLNARTQKEMDRLKFDEAALCKELGLTYAHIPVSTSKITAAEPFALTQLLAEQPGPVLMHCRSGSRAATIYGLHLVQTNQMTEDQARIHALDMGMSPGSVPYFQKALMQTPQRAIASVDTARVIDSVHTLTSFGTRHTLSDTKSETRGIGAARRWVYKAFEESIAGHNKPEATAPFVTFDSHTVEPDGRRITEQVEIVNVLCTIPGSNPESAGRLYYVLAHLDSRATEANDFTSEAPGANDDASGVAALIELARVLSKESLDSTIVLMATSGEEQGLFGAKLHAADLVASGADVRAVLNNDTIGDPEGSGDQDGSKEVRIFSEGLGLDLVNLDDPAQLKSALYRLRSTGSESDSPSRQLARYINFVGKLHGELPVKPKLIFRPDRYLRGGDHTPFNQLGMAAVRFCEVYENYDHQHQDIRIENETQYGDLATFVDARYLAGVTKLNTAVLVHLANAPSTPTDARIITADLTNDTTLRWTASPESDTAGYEVLWRQTTDADWSHFKDVGNVTEATIDLSKDNWLFAVRSYDNDGYRSPAAYPSSAKE